MVSLKKGNLQVRQVFLLQKLNESGDQVIINDSLNWGLVLFKKRKMAG
jgi:hypothetical protein